MKQTFFDRFSKLKDIPLDKFPRHVFIIPDGNGRWAQKLGNVVLKGHETGARVIRQLLRDLGEIEQIKIVTVWGFSSDNWKRGKKEVAGLMALFKKSFEETVGEIIERNGRFIHLGRKDRIPKDLLKTIETVEKKTKENTGQIVCIAIDFGGEDQELRVIEKARKLPLSIPTNKKLLWQLRDGSGTITPADLLIRTAGERRTSDVGWLNSSPTEIYIINKLFPDISTSDIIEAISDFSKRERRMGARI